MKISECVENVHVLDDQSNEWSLIRDIVSSGVQEEAFYVCDLGDIVQKHTVWKSLMPRVEPHYAVKCNDDLIVLKILAGLGTGFDCASKSEINKILSLGVEPHRIIFANPAKPASHIRYAAQEGVNTMTFDNESELHKIKNLFPDAKLVVRIRCDTAVTQCNLGIKFGCHPVTEAPNLLCLAHSLGLEVIGVSFHVGSGCGEPAAFKRAIYAARDLFDFGTTLGYRMDLLDIGGGYPGMKGQSLNKIAEFVNNALEDCFPDPSVQVISEPGRFYVSSAYTLACSIHSIKQVISPDTGAIHTMYYINDGVYGSFSVVLFENHPITAIPLKEYSDAKLTMSSIWGPSCGGLDQILDNVILPEMNIGDWFVFENMGAYTLPLASPFNGFPVPKVHYAARRHTWSLLKKMLSLAEEDFINRIAEVQTDLTYVDVITDPWKLPPMSLQICRHEDAPMDDKIFEYISIEPIN